MKRGRESLSDRKGSLWGEEHSMQREQQCESPEVLTYRAWKNSKGARMAGAGAGESAGQAPSCKALWLLF